jgi:hypothetical protein
MHGMRDVTSCRLTKRAERGTRSPQVEELPTGSLSAERAVIGSEVAIENHAHAQSQTAESNNKLNGMKTIFETAAVARQPLPLREAIPFWFALSSPLIGVLMGLLGAWFVTWLSA